MTCAFRAWSRPVLGGGDQRPDDVRNEPVLSPTRTYDPVGEMYSNGTILVVLELDPRIGVIEIERVVPVEGCRTMLYPTIVEGEVSGAVVQGTGGAILEDIATRQRASCSRGRSPNPPDEHGRAQHRGRAHRDAVAGHRGRRQGPRRGWHDRHAGGRDQRRRGCAASLRVRSVDRRPLDPEYILELIDQAATA